MIYYHLQEAYASHSWVRVATGIALFMGALLLYELSGGFPPWAWQLLFQVLLTLPSLWAMQGSSLIVPLTALIVLSLSLLALWVLFLTALVKMVQYWWQMRQTRRSFRGSAQEVNRMAVPNTLQRAVPTTGGGYRPISPAPPATASMTGKASSSAKMRTMMSPTASKSGYEAMSDDGARILASPPYATHSQQVLLMPTKHTIRLLVGAESDPGKKRKNAPNEDSILVVQETRIIDTGPLPLGLFVVADGMGGHANGDQASQLVVQMMRDMVLPALRRTETDEMACADLLHMSVQRANAALYERNQQQDAMMGTTMTAALVFGMRAHIVSVGDSRAYLYRPSQGLRQITRDHSIVAELVTAGIIAPDDMYTHPRRNEVTRCLGDEVEVAIDSFIVPLQREDVLLLCSDGLWEMVRYPDIEEIVALARRDAEHLARLLIQAALNRGGEDNVSVIVMEVASAA
jgi:serine/threonine protein phosphatase PrpC